MIWTALRLDIRTICRHGFRAWIQSSIAEGQRVLEYELTAEDYAEEMIEPHMPAGQKRLARLAALRPNADHGDGDSSD